VSDTEKRAQVICVGGTTASALICIAYGSAVPFQEQWPLFEALRTTASIVLAVIGAWLSIIYPKALQAAFSRTQRLSDSDSRSLDLMIATIRISTGILVAVMFLGLFAKILQQIPAIVEYTSELRAASFGLLGALTFIQFWTLMLTLAQAHIAQNDVIAEKERKKAIDNHVRHTQKQHHP
jgi:hypothetical protein